MNSFINILLLIVTFPTMLLCIFIGFDLPIEFLRTTARTMPYASEILLVFGLLLLVISLRRSIRRWMGVRMTKQTKKFHWNSEISQTRKQRVIVYTLLEAAVLLSLALGYYFLTPDAWFPALVMLVFSIESIVFLLICSRKLFRIGLSSKAILVADREVILIYLAGLRQVSISQQTVYFDYTNDLQLSFPTDCLLAVEKDLFFENLSSLVDKNKVLFRNVTTS
jgi:hypothetical protein